MFIDDYKADIRFCQKENDLQGITKVLMAYCESTSRQLTPKNHTTEDLVTAFLEGRELNKELLVDHFGMSDHKARYFALSMERHFGAFVDPKRRAESVKLVSTYDGVRTIRTVEV